MPYPETNNTERSDKFSPSYVRDRQPLGCTLPLDAPYFVLIDSSEACNFKCSYCFRGDPAAAPSHSYARSNMLMSWEIFRQSVDQLHEFTLPVKKISLSGHGEPLCNRKLPEMVRYIKKSGFTCPIEIHTNGSLLDDDFACDLADSGIDRVIFSIQGVNAAAYQKNAGIALNFDQFLKNLEVFYRKKNHTMVYAKTVDTCLAEDEDSVFRDVFSKVADVVFIENTLPLWKGQKEVVGEFYNKFNKAVPYQHCCPLAFYSIFIAPDGTVYPCTQPEMSLRLGNVLVESLTACWKSAARMEFLVKHLREGRGTIPDCADCYIAQNSIMTEEDMIDQYRVDILSRMERKQLWNR